MRGTPCLIERAGNAINAASTTSALPKKKGAPGPPSAKMLPAASGPTARPSPATPCARPSVSPCAPDGLANERSVATIGVTTPSPALTMLSAISNSARFVLHESSASPAASRSKPAINRLRKQREDRLHCGECQREEEVNDH